MFGNPQLNSAEDLTEFRDFVGNLKEPIVKEEQAHASLFFYQDPAGVQVGWQLYPSYLRRLHKCHKCKCLLLNSLCVPRSMVANATPPRHAGEHV